MNPSVSFTIDLLRLADGTRLIRVADTASGTTLERRIDPTRPLARQKELVVTALRALLDRELSAAAA